MLVALLCIFAICAYFYIKRTFFTPRPDIPGLPPQFLIGNLGQTGVISGNTNLHEIYEAFRYRYGDVFQYWMGPNHLIIVNDINDVQHIFVNRHIYDQGDIFIKQTRVLYPNGLICTKGFVFLLRLIFKNRIKVMTTMFLLLGSQFKRHASVTLPLFRRAKIISYFDLITDCVDKLITRWRSRPKDQVNTDIFTQCQHLLLAIFGFIGFDYDLQVLDEESETSTNELAEALQEFSSVFQTVIYTPPWLSRAYLKMNSRHQRAKRIIEKYLYSMIEQEINESSESRAQRKRTSLIASLVTSLQSDETIESMKNEDERKGL